MLRLKQIRVFGVAFISLFSVACSQGFLGKEKSKSETNSDAPKPELIEDPLLLVEDPASEGAVLAQPALTIELNSSTVFFSWNAVTGASGYALGIGTSKAAIDARPWGDIIYKNTTATDLVVTNVPINGNPIFVRLWTKLPTKWVSKYYSIQTKKDEMSGLLAKIAELKTANDAQSAQIATILDNTKQELQNQGAENAKKIEEKLNDLLTQNALVAGKYATDLTAANDVEIFASSVESLGLTYRLSLFGNRTTRFDCDGNLCANRNRLFVHVITPISKTAFYLSDGIDTKRYELTDAAENRAAKPTKFTYTCDASNRLGLIATSSGVQLDYQTVSINDKDLCQSQMTLLAEKYTYVKDFTQVATCNSSGQLTVFRLSAWPATSAIDQVIYSNTGNVAGCMASAAVINGDTGVSDQFRFAENMRQSVAYCSGATLVVSTVHTPTGLGNSDYYYSTFSTVSEESCRAVAKDITESRRRFQGITQYAYCSNATRLVILIGDSAAANYVQPQFDVANCTAEAAKINKNGVGLIDQTVNTFACDTGNRLRITSSYIGSAASSYYSTTAESCQSQADLLNARFRVVDEFTHVRVCTGDNRVHAVILKGAATGAVDYYTAANQAECVAMAAASNNK